MTASLLTSDAAAVAIGAVFGALSRYQAGKVAAEWIASDPRRLGGMQGWHTAGINIAGSFALGGLAGAPVVGVNTPPPQVAKTAGGPFSNLSGLTPRTKLCLGVGYCGAFTTFSTYSVDVATWLSQGQTKKALTYVMTNNVGGVVAAAAGMVIAKRFFGR